PARAPGARAGPAGRAAVAAGTPRAAPGSGQRRHPGGGLDRLVHIGRSAVPHGPRATADREAAAMIRSMRPAAATILVQVAAVALVLGRPSVAQACATGVAALLFLLANDPRGPGTRFSRARTGIL